MDISQLIKDCLKLKQMTSMNGNPVAVTYCDEIPNESFNTDKQVICQSIQDARFGDKIAINAENSICRGGNYFIGLTEKSPEQYKFWTEMERISATRCASASLDYYVPSPPPFLSKYITLSPVEKCNRFPDLILFVLPPEQAARILGLSAYINGRPSKIYSYAAACASAIGIPAVTGELHVSFIDNSARYIADFSKDELIVTIPSLQICGISNSIEDCVWGVAKVPYHVFEEKLKGTWKKKE